VNRLLIPSDYITIRSDEYSAPVNSSSAQTPSQPDWRAAEDEIMRRHPEIGYDLLKDVSGMTPEILDGVRHHHEYLDGSGYPDGLTAPKISDLVRLLTISDIFAALIEARPYRAPTPRHTAYQILCDMGGKLEGSLAGVEGEVP